MAMAVISLYNLSLDIKILMGPEGHCLPSSTLPNYLIFRVNLNHITIVDGMGFTKEEAKSLLLKCPELYQYKDGEKLQTM